MKVITRLAVGVCVALLPSACHNPQSSPTAPTQTTSAPTATAGPPVPAGPYTAPVWNWNLTTVLTAVTGPANCFTEQQVRAGIPRSISWQLEVTRAGNEVTFDYDVRNYPTDNVRETGRVDGREFTARSVTWPTATFVTCPDGTVLSGTFDASVTGRFSDDGRHLTAKEVWAYRFSSGEVTFLLDWSANQR